VLAPLNFRFLSVYLPIEPVGQLSAQSIPIASASLEFSLGLWIPDVDSGPRKSTPGRAAGQSDSVQRRTQEQGALFPDVHSAVHQSRVVVVPVEGLFRFVSQPEALFPHVDLGSVPDRAVHQWLVVAVPTERHFCSGALG
jgi:hypothetical protein